MPKILYVITQGEWGGAQRYVFDLVTNLKYDFEITVAVGESAGRVDLQNKLRSWNTKHGALNISIIPLKYLIRQISPFHDILAVFEIVKLCKTLKPDAVHLNSSKAGIIGSLARLLTIDYSLLTIYTVHGWVFNEPNRKIDQWFYRFLEKFTARWKDKIIVLSPQDFTSGKRLGIPEKKLIEIPLGIETPEFLYREEARRFLNPRIRGDDIIIGTIANLYKTKGIDILIEAINLLKRNPSAHPPAGGFAQDDSTRVIVIGEGPERKKLESLIKKYNLENTVFLIGALDNAAQYLPAFDIFVLPSRKEGFPYTLLEAIASKVPIITTNVGGIPSLIENKKNGLLIPPENPQDLSDAVLYALNHLEEMKLMAKRNEKEEKQDLPKMLNQTTLLYLP
ncbi:MAG: glycosyltransferase family 4 protein [Candidatus Magasanikbacteria bacterium]|nr:glycosyltransferase family 4 protein [Candidatus Magasanikbacteria bacterium]